MVSVRKGRMVMSQEEQFLVSGAELKCPNGTKTCELRAGEGYAMVQIGSKVFPPVQAAIKGENIEGFGMCLATQGCGGAMPCMAKAKFADQWINPATVSKVMSVRQEEEAIHRLAKLLCISGKANIRALTTGQVELTESERKFYKYMQDMFGFDDKVIAIMLKVIYAIDRKYPEESERKKAWRFARLMGGFSYGYGAEDRFIEIRNGLVPNMNESVNYDNIAKDRAQWKLTAGIYDGLEEGVSEIDYFVKTLQLSESEYYTLRFHVMAQHEITSRPAACHPVYMSGDGGIEGHTHPYKTVWSKYFQLSDQDGNFEEEWTRLYQKYVSIPESDYQRLSNNPQYFGTYGNIDKEVSNAGYTIEPVYADFSHQQILTSTITLENADADIGSGVMGGSTIGLLSLLSGNILFTTTGLLTGVAGGVTVHDYRTSLAGWLGDLKLADGKMSEDDYKADLDGYNISSLIIDEDMNTVEAVNTYYESLEMGTATRENEFLCNMGNGNAENGLAHVEILIGGFDLLKEGEQKVRSLLDKEASEDIGQETTKAFLERISADIG